ncbi:MAG: Beta-lactamase class C-like and penicillin binding proteins (PBPs) superfamily [Cytophagales bacterium]|jgi:CubicO group peptidase (beta-lactamase class C family)|nr:serine hydrolase [Bacteroidota bacterium]MBS1980555.1 serine hydrolase [Bacteroidota bacterium]WHZ07876.1 MAG: Beta-lactamase class C-like and penicillin binding proteins (PBPs) superfamily [Cytophagales bacterium]
MNKVIQVLIVSIIFFSCTKNNPSPSGTSTLYFPPNSGTWQTVTPASLGWNVTALTTLLTYLDTTNTRAFIVLKDGKIVIEHYAGTQLSSTNSFTSTSNWYWASAGKTLTAAIVGIANANGKINLDAKTSDYLGAGWTSETLDQENKITVRNHLTMTTGLDDYNGGATGDNDCSTPPCLIYKADAGTRWAYHTGAYTVLDKVIQAGTGQNTNTYGSAQLFSKIGMDGSFIMSGENNLFYSTGRSMARFGLLLLSKGTWNGTAIIPESYFELMITTSQNLNLSYGYLTWLNGKASYMSPGPQIVTPNSLTPNAPADMFAAMGKNGQLINVVPSKNIVVIRLGDAPDNNLVPLTYQNVLWNKLNAVITN